MLRSQVAEQHVKIRIDSLDAVVSPGWSEAHHPLYVGVAARIHIFDAFDVYGDLFVLLRSGGHAQQYDQGHQDKRKDRAREGISGHIITPS